MHAHITNLTGRLVALLNNKAPQHKLTATYTAYCEGLGLNVRTPGGRPKFTQFEQGQVSGCFHGFMASIKTVHAYEFNGHLYTTHKDIPEGFRSTEELHQLGLTQDQWNAMPRGLYYTTGELYFKSEE